MTASFVPASLSTQTSSRFLLRSSPRCNMVWGPPWCWFRREPNVHAGEVPLHGIQTDASEPHRRREVFEVLIRLTRLAPAPGKTGRRPRRCAGRSLLL